MRLYGYKGVEVLPQDWSDLAQDLKSRPLSYASFRDRYESFREVLL